MHDAHPSAGGDEAAELGNAIDVMALDAFHLASTEDLKADIGSRCRLCHRFPVGIGAARPRDQVMPRVSKL